MARRTELTRTVSADGSFEGPDADTSRHRVDGELDQHVDDRRWGTAAGRVLAHAARGLRCTLVPRS